MVLPHCSQIIFRETNESQNEIHPNSSQRKNFLLMTLIQMMKILIRIKNKMLKMKTLKWQHLKQVWRDQVDK